MVSSKEALSNSICLARCPARSSSLSWLLNFMVTGIFPDLILFIISLLLLPFLMMKCPALMFEL